MLWRYEKTAVSNRVLLELRPERPLADAEALRRGGLVVVAVAASASRIIRRSRSPSARSRSQVAWLGLDVRRAGASGRTKGRR